MKSYFTYDLLSGAIFSQEHTFIQRWISQKWYKIETHLQWNNDINLDPPYSTVQFGWPWMS